MDNPEETHVGCCDDTERGELFDQLEGDDFEEVVIELAPRNS